MSDMTVDPQLDLYWIPLGAGARVVRTSGRVYEACAALTQARAARLTILDVMRECCAAEE